MICKGNQVHFSSVQSISSPASSPCLRKTTHVFGIVAITRFEDASGIVAWCIEAEVCKDVEPVSDCSCC